jgi:hypothetical protein
MRRASLAAAVLACSIPLTVGAQAPPVGRIEGCVTDSDRIGIPGVTVRVIAAGVERQAVTARNGCYAVEEVPAGRARIVAELAGFLAQARGGFSRRSSDLATTSWIDGAIAARPCSACAWTW